MKVNKLVNGGVIKAYERAIINKLSLICEVASRTWENSIPMCEFEELIELVFEFKDFLNDNEIIEDE